LYEYEFRIPVDFAYIVRAIMTLEGISLQLDPDFDIFAVSAPYAVRMMLTFPDPSLRERLLGELLTAEGRVDWARLQDLAALAAHDTRFRLETEGLAAPALEMLLSPEGAALREALVDDFLQAPEASSAHIESLAPLLASDPSVSGQAILERLIAFLLSPEGEPTRAQLVAGLRSRNGGSARGTSSSGGSLDMARLMDLASMAGRLHPEFRPATLVRALGSYLFSEEGKPVRNQLLMDGAQRIADNILGQLTRPQRPAPSLSAGSSAPKAGREPVPEV
jgi:hypothetical protein